ncbi:hypothetical protein [Methylomonas rhizoryzae]|uniref:hypothetical protein n=1 Tax=Methylomonas rhizoryzae TaxID=2608981 RepID=UPI001232D8D7|nr:hypothetical protein [Methylomonas rhizoryzae]
MKISTEITEVKATFGTSFGVCSAVLSVIDIYGKDLFIYSTSISILTTLVFCLFLIRKKRKIKKFFGILDNQSINISIASYRDIRKFQRELGEDKNMRYYKTKPCKTNGGEKILTYLTGATKYPLTDVGVTEWTVNFSLLLSQYISLENKIKVFGDEDFDDDMIGTVICIGSPTSNSTSGDIIDNLKSQGCSIEFTTNSLTCWRKITYQSDENKDYALLIKYTDDQRVFFVIAGIDEHGSFAVAKVLLKNWKKLPNADFIQLYEVNKGNTTIKEHVKTLLAEKTRNKNKKIEWIETLYKDH